ncbi:MAG: hypothetical protein MJ249_06110 [Kiritimatiellae bacterium]|nr:hypothetical protein [Kiritimatiellia bacterium]
MRAVQMLAMAAVCATAATGWARTMTVTSNNRDMVSLAFGQPDGTNYTLCVAYGDVSGGENKYKWASFRRNVATIAADQTTFTYLLPSDFTSGMFYRFFLLQTENLPYERELAYIASTSTAYGTSPGTQFIDTGIVGKSGTKMDANYVWLAGNDSTILGARADNTRYYLSHMYWNSDWYVGYNAWVCAKNNVGYKAGDAFHVVCELKKGVQSLVVNDQQLYHTTFSDTYDTKLNLYVFGCNYNGVPKVCIKAQLFDMKIWQDDVLKRSYRPVVLANGDGALYDEVTDAIFTNGSSTPFVLGDATDEENRRGIVRAMSPVLEVLTDEESKIPVTSYWEGGVDGDLSKDGNWRSINRAGEEVALAPVSTTVVHFSGTVNASWASTSGTLGAAKIVCEDVHLATNCDWRVFGSVPFEGNLDLNGWKLKLAGLTGTGAITDRPLVAAGYEALDYIEETDLKTHIDTGVVGATGVTVEIDVMGFNMYYDSCVVGSRSGGTRFLPFWGLRNRVCFGYRDFKGGGVSSPGFPNDDFTQGKRYVGYNRMRDGSQNTYMNGIRTCNGTIEGEYNTGKSIYIFCMNYDDKADYYAPARLYAARFWTGGGTQLVRDFVPVRQTSDGALGLYDKVEGTFYAKQGTGSFNAGAAVAAPVGPAGELWIDVAEGATNVNTGVVIAGGAKLVKSGKGAYRTMVLNQTYTGGTRVADGVFDQGVNSTNDSMPLGQNEVTVVFDKEADIEWNDGCYFSWETRPANTTFTLSQKMLFKGFVLIEKSDGIYIRKPKFYIFFR